MGAFSSRGVLTRLRQGLVDVAVLAGAAVLLWALVRLPEGVTAPFDAAAAPSTVSTDPAELPYYAARLLLRMFVALAASIVFTSIYAIGGARLRSAEKVLLPVLGFLSVTVTGFIALFSGCHSRITSRASRTTRRGCRAGSGCWCPTCLAA